MRDTRKGLVPLSTPALSRTAKARNLRASEPVSRQPDADETLRVVLACLDDMKAEDITTIDLTGNATERRLMGISKNEGAR